MTEDFSALPNTAKAVQPIVQSLLDGLSIGARAVPQQLAARWPAFGTSITRVVERLGAAWRDPLAARRIQYRLERLVLEYDDLPAVRELSLTAGLRVDLHHPVDFIPAAGVDRLYVYLCDGDAVKAIVDIGVLGTVLRQDWLELARAHVSPELIDPRAGVDLRSVLAPAALRSAVRTGFRASRQVEWGSDMLRSARHVMKQAVTAAAASPYPPESHVARLEAMRSSTIADPPVVVPSETPAPAIALSGGEDSQAYWEQLFQQTDPWRYGSAYEQEKYLRQLSLLPIGPIGRGLELACAEGHFTQSLAPRVGSLIATDISVTALERARARCEGLTNITFRQLDLATDALPAELDLIVCSEVLYYLDGTDALAQVAGRFAAALRPGGHLLTAHAIVLADDSTRSGFDWGIQWGGETIARALASTPGLALEQSVQTDLYRIDRFVRLAPGIEAPTPVVEHAPIAGELDVEAERHVIWGGAVARRDVLKVSEQHDRIPVLMYHSVAPDGPAALARWRVTPEAFRTQMRWLRRHGYHTIRSEELVWFLGNRHPFVGRPVMITFDDGLQTFADHAWPILRRSDMGAEVFIVTDLVGQTARWETDPRDATPLMDEATIIRLAGEGVVFGSHLATHRGADALPTQALTEELLRSRAALHHWLGHPVDALAAPFGLTDGRLRRLAAECGYRVCYSTVDSVATLDADPLHVPRIEVRGDWSLEQFAARMEESR